MPVWTVPATITRVVDADTLEADLDLGWRITYHAKIRLAGVNAPERNTLAGNTARHWVIDTLQPDPAAFSVPVMIVSHMLDKYGRVLADVYLANPTPGVVLPVTARPHLNRMLLDAGHAVPA